MKTGKKRLAALFMTAMFAVMASLAAFASEATGTASAATVTAVTGLAADMVATIQAVIPIALTVVGLGLVVMAGIRVFRRIAKP